MDRSPQSALTLGAAAIALIVAVIAFIGRPEPAPPAAAGFDFSALELRIAELERRLVRLEQPTVGARVDAPERLAAPRVGAGASPVAAREATPLEPRIAALERVMAEWQTMRALRRWDEWEGVAWVLREHGRAFEPLDFDGLRDSAALLREIALDPAAPDDHRFEALRGLREFGGSAWDQSVALSLATLARTSEEVGVREAIWDHLEDVDMPILVPTMLDAARHDEHLEVRILAMWRLQEYWDHPGVAAAVREMAGADSSAEVREVAGELLEHHR